MNGSAAIPQSDSQGARRAAVLAVSAGLHAALFAAAALFGQRLVLPETTAPPVEMMFETMMPVREAAMPPAVEPTASAMPEPADTPAPEASRSMPPLPDLPPPQSPATMPQAELASTAAPLPLHPPMRRSAPAKTPNRIATAAPEPARTLPSVPPTPQIATIAAPIALPAPQAISPQWQGSLASWIRARKQYPEEARQLGQEGGVLLRFTVLRDGEVRDSQIVRGSGSSILDQAALTIIRAGRLPAFPPEMSQPQVTVTVPVRYRIED